MLTSPGFFFERSQLVHINPRDTVEGFNSSHHPRYAERRNLCDPEVDWATFNKQIQE